MIVCCCLAVAKAGQSHGKPEASISFRCPVYRLTESLSVARYSVFNMKVKWRKRKCKNTLSLCLIFPLNRINFKFKFILLNLIHT